VPYHKPQFVRDIDGNKLDLARCDWTTNVYAPEAVEILWPITVVQEFLCACGEIRYASESIGEPCESPAFDSLDYHCPKCRTYYKKLWRVPQRDRLRIGFIPWLSEADYRRMYMPGEAPSYKKVKGGKIKATIESRKPDSKLFSEWSIADEAIGASLPDVERHVEAFLAWNGHYETYYNLTGWEVRVLWKK